MAIGVGASAAQTTAAATTAVGYQALNLNTASNNTAIGYKALAANTTGTNNVAMGRLALTANTTASNGTAIGHNALAANTTSTNNTAVGNSALAAVSTGAHNTAVGTSAAAALTTGGGVVAVGDGALLLATTGAGNVAIGQNAGYSPAGVPANATVVGSKNTFVGYQTGLSNTSDYSGTTAIGYRAVTGGNYATSLGTAPPRRDHGSVSIGCDHTGAGATTSTQDVIALGTALHAVLLAGAPTASAAAYIKGGLYFDTTLNKLRIGGATAWET